MNEPPTPAVSFLPIAAVERDTGLGKDTLRAWERRYGFPAPARDPSGERVYSTQDVQKLCLLKRLIERGERPGRLVHLGPAALQARLDEHADAQPRRLATQGFLELIRAHDVNALRRRLRERRTRLGPARFVVDVVAPFEYAGRRGLDARPAAGVRGAPVHRVRAGGAARDHPDAPARPPGRPAARPRLLLTTFPGEPHGLGLLMAETIATLDGARCLSLGVATPLWDIGLAARALECDVAALSFSGCLNPNQVVEGLTELRARLGPRTALWAGGAAPVLHRRAVPGVTAIASLSQIGAELQRWRQSLARP